jgi:catechol 2,3-dioxygenase-like lactoylglutathione lyase family enzyme
VTFNIARVDHVHITAPAELEDDVFAWYEKTLGLERVHKPEGTRAQGAWFRVGDQEIHISQDEHNPPKFSHFGLVVDDLEAAVGALRGSGCHIEQATAIPGRRRFYTRDPAGNRVEILSFTESKESST